MLAAFIGAISLAIWVYLVAGRGGFWRVRGDAAPPLKTAPTTVAVLIPARNEAAEIGAAVTSLLSQSYAGPTHIFVVDDQSSDGTAQSALRAAAAAGAANRFTLVAADPLPPGWTGKLWAISCGLRHSAALRPGYILLTDADIVHSPDNLTNLVARAEAGGLDLVSLMVRLRCQSFPERALIPAFLFFFLKLYPPAWIAELDARTAGAAGGCILIRSTALDRIGGIESIRGELIDDCALARQVKRGGPIWMGLSTTTISTRTYDTFGDIERMIARTAYTQLRYSPLLLAGTVAGLLLTYAAPLALAIASTNLTARLLGLAAWLLMSLCYLPTLRLYRRSPCWAPALPLVALFYLEATLHSAVAHWTGRGGLWKGRFFVP